MFSYRSGDNRSRSGTGMDICALCGNLRGLHFDVKRRKKKMDDFLMEQLIFSRNFGISAIIAACVVMIVVVCICGIFENNMD